jgi:adenine-specific DNA-methyltransferase
LDSVCNAPDSDLWHTLIEADNYHALQLLEYLYAGKVDCIYIDPPYNTGAKDWKYNNDYVDGNDEYRHSKWLSFMQKRLEIAKRLLNPYDSVLILTIDEKEYLHLGCLLEEMFSEAKIQMVSSLMNRHGTSRSNEFSRTNEFIYFVMLGDYSISSIDSATYLSEGSGLHWHTLRRSTASNIRDEQHPNQFYPIYVDITTNTVTHYDADTHKESVKTYHSDSVNYHISFSASKYPDRLRKLVNNGQIIVYLDDL